MKSPVNPGRSPGDAEVPLGEVHPPRSTHASETTNTPGLLTEREQQFLLDRSWANQNRRARVLSSEGRPMMPMRTPMPAAFRPPVLKGGPPPEPEAPPPARWGSTAWFGALFRKRKS